MLKLSSVGVLLALPPALAAIDQLGYPWAKLMVIGLVLAYMIRAHAPRSRGNGLGGSQDGDKS